MRQTTQANQTADYRSAGVLTRGASPDIGAGVPLIGRLLRRRSRKGVAAKDANDAVSPRRIRPYHYSDAARSPMEAGITRGVSLLFGEFDSRR
jgi:hypothetical protein